MASNSHADVPVVRRTLRTIQHQPDITSFSLTDEHVQPSYFFNWTPWPSHKVTFNIAADFGDILAVNPGMAVKIIAVLAAPRELHDGKPGWHLEVEILYNLVECDTMILHFQITATSVMTHGPGYHDYTFYCGAFKEHRRLGCSK